MTDLIDTHEAARILGFTGNTLRNARVSGFLGGVTAPGFRKLGTAIRYERSALDRWVAQFEEQTTTHEAA
ncbi:MAG: DNA-binding protein [Gammaproteobacteria bacterium]|nr:MAG: DNA-binding protein [Gammaproteobacteria bacterium]